MKGKAADRSLAPGFRFHPTDEELVRYYLKRKVAHKPLRLDPISQIDIYKAEPWDLPGKSRLKTRDLEWYFFSALDKKYGNGSKTNRATDKGYWKTTGKDRPVPNASRILGMKKTLVYHFGRAPRGHRTNWVMHEYRLIDDELEKAGFPQDAFVLCRIFQKSGPGPKNGEKYGAPFVEEEWEDNYFDDEMTPSPVLQGDFDANELHQDANFGISSGDAPPPNCFYNGDTSKCSKHKEAPVEEKSEAQISFSGSMQQPDGLNLVDLPKQCQVKVAPVEPEEGILSPDDLNGLNLDDLLDGTFMDAPDNLALEDTPYLQTDNPSISAETNAADFNLDEFLNFYDAEDNVFMDKDSSQMMLGVDDYYFDGSSFAPNISNQTAKADLLPEGTQDFALPQEYMGSPLFNPHTEADWLNSDIDNKLLEDSTNFWENLPCPPAYASEFPSKDVLVQLSSMSPSSSTSAHNTTAMLRIRNITLSSKGVDLSFGRNGKFNLVLSFQMAEDVPALGATTTSVSTTPSSSWSWLSCLFLWAIFIPVTCKLASFMRAG